MLVAVSVVSENAAVGPDRRMAPFIICAAVSVVPAVAVTSVTGSGDVTFPVKAAPVSCANALNCAAVGVWPSMNTIAMS